MEHVVRSFCSMAALFALGCVGYEADSTTEGEIAQTEQSLQLIRSSAPMRDIYIPSVVSWYPYAAKDGVDPFTSNVFTYDQWSAAVSPSSAQMAANPGKTDPGFGMSLAEIPSTCLLGNLYWQACLMIQDYGGMDTTSFDVSMDFFYLGTSSTDDNTAISLRATSSIPFSQLATIYPDMKSSYACTGLRYFTNWTVRNGFTQIPTQPDMRAQALWRQPRTISNARIAVRGSNIVSRVRVTWFRTAMQCD